MPHSKVLESICQRLLLLRSEEYTGQGNSVERVTKILHETKSTMRMYAMDELFMNLISKNELIQIIKTIDNKFKVFILLYIA